MRPGSAAHAGKGVSAAGALGDAGLLVGAFHPALPVGFLLLTAERVDLLLLAELLVDLPLALELLEREARRGGAVSRLRCKAVCRVGALRARR